jgi:hypothetical protein
MIPLLLAVALALPGRAQEVRLQIVMELPGIR